jgi:hypothetical protein
MQPAQAADESNPANQAHGDYVVFLQTSHLAIRGFHGVVVETTAQSVLCFECIEAYSGFLRSLNELGICTLEKRAPVPPDASPTCWHMLVVMNWCHPCTRGLWACELFGWHIVTALEVWWRCVSIIPPFKPRRNGTRGGVPMITQYHAQKYNCTLNCTPSCRHEASTPHSKSRPQTHQG